MTSKVGMLTCLGGVMLLVSGLLILLLLMFMCSPEFDMADYGVKGVLETLGVFGLGAALGLLLLGWAKSSEDVEQRSKDEIILRDTKTLEAHPAFRSDR